MRKTIALLTCMFAGVWNLSAADSVIDFDGGSAKSKRIESSFDDIARISLFNAPTPIMLPPKPEGEHQIRMKMASGEVIAPVSIQTKDGKTEYDFDLPHQTPACCVEVMYKCRAPSGTWSIDLSFAWKPTLDHLHDWKNAPPLGWTPYGRTIPPGQVSESNIPVGDVWHSYSLYVNDFAVAFSVEFLWGGACASSSPKEDIAKIRVHDPVTGKLLHPMPVSAEPIAYELVPFPSQDANHTPAVHNVTDGFEQDLRNMANRWQFLCPPASPLQYQLMSLPWGGAYDINSDWKKPYYTAHEWGTDADISKINVRKENRKKLIQTMCENHDVWSETYPSKDPSHYHVRLRGASETANMSKDEQYCCQSEIPQACVNLAPGYSEPAPSEGLCPVPKFNDFSLKNGIGDIE